MKLVLRALLGAAAVWSSAFAAPASLEVLSDDDADLYAEIFDLQEQGEWDAADARIAKLSDPILMGYVKRARFLHEKSARTAYADLKEWMAYYADHPAASEIYDLALKRRAKRDTLPVRPALRQWRVEADWEIHPDLAADYDRTSRPRLEQIEGRVRQLAKSEQANLALDEIEKRRREGVITDRQFDRMRSWIAASLYYQGHVERAREIAAAVAARHGDVAVLSLWIEGLAGFRAGDQAAAYKAFARMARIEFQEDGLRAGAGFWAARAALAAGHVEDIAPNLEIAADFPLTFYGQLALAQLGRACDFNWTPPEASAEGLARLEAKAPAIRRALALAQAGRAADADAELRWINGLIEEEEEETLLAIATALDLPAAQIDIATTGSSRGREASLFPLPKFEPAGGFTTDRAVIFALMKQESKFKVDATSHAGARGLMQLMPRTASWVARDKSLSTSGGRHKLYDPATNLAIAQTYVSQLLSASDGGSLFDMAVAYNGGPGNLRRWKREVAIDDPLLFIESIPNPESRDYVEKVLTNIWVYRARLGQDDPSRYSVAAGDLPAYEALDQAFPPADAGRLADR